VQSTWQQKAVELTIPGMKRLLPQQEQNLLRLGQVSFWSMYCFMESTPTLVFSVQPSKQSYMSLHKFLLKMNIFIGKKFIFGKNLQAHG
jgi:hypothetical protein